MLCVINAYSKYTWVVPLKGKKDITITSAFQGVYNIFSMNFQWILQYINEMYSSHNEGKSAVAEKFIRTLKNKIYKYMTSTSNNAYIDQLADLVNEYNNELKWTLLMQNQGHILTLLLKIMIKIVNVIRVCLKQEKVTFTPRNAINLFSGDHVRVSKYKNNFA